MLISFKRLLQISVCLIFPLLLLLALSDRITHTYLEDDLLWFIPLISQFMEKFNVLELVKVLHTAMEVTFHDGAYLGALLSVFGYNFKNFMLVSIFLYVTNSILFYILLRKGLKLGLDVSFLSSLMYFSFYGNFHAYVWPFSAHHLLVLGATFLILIFYMKANALMEEGQCCTKYYWVTLFLAVPASFLKISILMIPFIIFMHILFASGDNTKILKKYSLWLPLFILFLTYQLIVLFSDGHGSGLIGVLGPFRHVSWASEHPIIVAFIITISMFFVIGFLLKKFLENKCPDILFFGIGWLSFLLVLKPDFLFLCLNTFLWPVQSALFDDVLMRLQGIAFPQAGWAATLGYIFIIAIMLCFLRYMIKRNRHLIIFVPWYLMTLPYLSLSHYRNLIPSRYLVYVSCIFSVMFCLFFCEILPKLFSEKIRKKYIAVFYVLIFAVSIINIFSIKIRLLRTVLVDYHWSYDYVKIANVISQDIRTQVDTSGDLPYPVCVSGIRDIPNKEGWKRRFLSQFDFSKYDIFRQTLTAALNTKKADIIVRDQCPDSRLSYTVDGFSVLNQKGENIEPFYKLLHQGIQSLAQGDDRKAIDALEEAVRQKPFLIHLMTDSFVFKGVLRDILMEKIADDIYGIYGVYHDGDEKMNYIENMVQGETHDYGMALALLSYLKDIESGEQESVRLLKESALFIPLEDVLEYPLDRDLPRSGTNNFHAFIKRNVPVFLAHKRVKPWVVIESYKGFNIIRHREFYYGLSQKEGDFNLARFKNNRYEYAIWTKTKHEIRKFVDSLSVKPHASLGGTVFPYKDFMIEKSGDMYLCFQKENQIFKSRSLIEAKLVIDTLGDM